MKTDNQNFFLAMALSILVLIGWQYFYAGPQIDEAKRRAAQSSSSQSSSIQTSPSVTSASPSPAENSPTSVSPSMSVVATREQALKGTTRVRIDTPKLGGSLALKGGRIDDLSLKAYHETVSPESPNIVLFSPAGGPNAFYAEFGWVPSGAGTKVPDATTVWAADHNTLTPEQPVTLTTSTPDGLVFRRVVSVDANAMFTIADTVENTGAQTASLFPYGLVSRHGKPVVQGYYILHEGLIGVGGEQGLLEYTYDAIAKEPVLAGGVHGRIWKGAVGGFVGITDKYWAAAVIPDQETTFEARFSTAPGVPVTYQADLVENMATLAPGKTITSTKRLFAGAKEVATIEGYEKTQNIKRFDLLIDWGWFYFITKPLFRVIDWFYKLTGNFGVSILIVTVLLKLAFLPLANTSYRSMAKMKAVQPEMLALRDRYADDRLKQQQELMALYKREQINPVAGCWPMLIQIPVFFALYKVLFVTIEMRHAPFYGWIRDLAAPDPTSLFNLFGLLPYSVPPFLSVGVWPILMGITMFMQMKMNPEPTDPVQKTMFTWMPLIFTFMLASFPAGLVMYWTWNNLLSILQQGYIMKKHGTKIELLDNIKGMIRKKPA